MRERFLAGEAQIAPRRQAADLEEDLRRRSAAALDCPDQQSGKAETDKEQHEVCAAAPAPKMGTVQKKHS